MLPSLNKILDAKDTGEFHGLTILCIYLYLVSTEQSIMKDKEVLYLRKYEALLQASLPLSDLYFHSFCYNKNVLVYILFTMVLFGNL